MKIGIDSRMYKESGVGRYIRNLLINLQKLDKNNQYFIFLLKDTYDTLEYHNNFTKVLASFHWYGVSEQIKFPKLLTKLNLDLMHFPHFNVPFFYQGKFVVTIHDLIHQHFQMRRATTLDPITYKIKQLGYKLVFKNAISKAVKILVPSNYVKGLLVRQWGINGNEVVVTHEAVDDKIVAIANSLSQKKLKIKSPYIFYVGNAHPHKNIEGLIRVFRDLREKYPHLQLVLTGYDHYFWQKVMKEYQYQDIIYTGQVSDEELAALYKNARLFVMPSFEEGFGMPLLEAMAGGCPVVSSNAGSLPEVGGDAALYFDPADMRDMGDKIGRVLTDNSLRNNLIKKGKQRVKVFSWEKLARQTLEVYLQCG